MKATIDGDSLSCSTTRKEGLALMLLRYLQFHTPEHWGQHVLIRVTDEELFEGSNPEERTPTKEEVLFAMKRLATTANDLWFEQIQNHTLFDEVLGIPLPNLQDIKLEVVNEVCMDDEKGLISKCYAFQILTKRWVGIRSMEGFGYYSDFYIPPD